MRPAFAPLLAIGLTSQLLAADYYPPTTRFGLYGAGTYQGVIGGIPTRSGGTVRNVVNYGWSAGNTGAQNTAAFNAAVAASAGGDVISIPAGTFQTDGLGIDRTQWSRTVRGAGKLATILMTTAGRTAWYVAGNQNYGNTSNPKTTVTGMTRGSAVISVANGNMPSAENGNSYDGNEWRLARIKLANEAVTPTMATMGFTGVQAFTVQLMSKTSNTLTLSQPLPSAFADSLAAGTAEIEVQFQTGGYAIVGVGLEDLTLDSNASIVANASVVNQVVIASAVQCWLKGVRTLNSGNYAVQLVDSVNCEIRDSDIYGASGGSNHAGILMNSASNCLIENNILSGGPAIEMNFGSLANVIAYNHSLDVVNGNHGPHNSFNLYEGNSWPLYQADGYFGGVSDETLFRNWARTQVSASLKRFTRRINYIGNVVGVIADAAGYWTDYKERWGDPNIGNESSVGTAQLSTGNAWADWDTAAGRPRQWTGTVTSRTSNTAGVITLGTGQGATLAAAMATNGVGVKVRTGAGHIFLTVTNISGDVVTFNTGSNNTAAQGASITLFPSPVGFQQKDLDVLATAIVKANWYVFHANSIPAGEALSSGETLPDSYFRATKPDWFGDRPWPPYNSANPGTPAVTNIPAGYRYTHGTNPVSGSKSPPQFVRIQARP